MAKQSAAQGRQAARAARKTELEPGDAVAFSAGDRWVAAVVVRTVTDKGGQTPVIEWYDWTGQAPPDKDTLADRPTRGGGVFLHGLWTRNDPRGRWRFVASGLPHAAAGRGFSIHRVAELPVLVGDVGRAR